MKPQPQGPPMSQVNGPNTPTNMSSFSSQYSSLMSPPTMVNTSTMMTGPSIQMSAPNTPLGGPRTPLTPTAADSVSQKNPSPQDYRSTDASVSILKYLDFKVYVWWLIANLLCLLRLILGTSSNCSKLTSWYVLLLSCVIIIFNWRIQLTFTFAFQSIFSPLSNVSSVQSNELGLLITFIVWSFCSCPVSTAY